MLVHKPSSKTGTSCALKLRCSPSNNTHEGFYIRWLWSWHKELKPLQKDLVRLSAFQSYYVLRDIIFYKMGRKILSLIPHWCTPPQLILLLLITYSAVTQVA